MNMISTAFTTESDASSKQNKLMKNLVNVWEKKNSKTSRAGGVSLLALSLAACGADDESVFTQADVDTAVAASNAVSEAAALEALALATVTQTQAVAAAELVAAGQLTQAVAAAELVAAGQLTQAVAAAELVAAGQLAQAVTAAETAAVAAIVDTTPFSQADVTAAEAVATAAATAAAIAADTTLFSQADVTAAEAVATAAGVASVDTAAAVSLALRNAAAEAGAVTFDGQTNAALIAAIKGSDNAGLADAAVAAANITGVTTLAQLTSSFTALANPTVTNFVLTNAANTVTGGADNFTGTAGDDTFMATADAALGNGDVVNGGEGNDTLTARYSVAADTTINTSVTGVETIIIDTDNGAAATNELNFNGGQVGLTELRIRDAIATNGAGADDINITSLALTTTVSVERGDGVFDVEFVYAGATGPTDAASLDLLASNVQTVTIANIETLNIEAVSGASILDNLSTAQTTTVNIVGSGGLTINTMVAAITTINASTATGNLTLQGIGAGTSVITAGDGNDTVDFGANLEALDTFTGGEGTDRVVVSTSETAALALVTGVEEIEIEAANQTNGTALQIAGTAVSSVNHFFSDVTANANNDDVGVTFSAMDDNDSITILTGGSDNTTLADGVAITGTLAADTTADDVTLTLAGINAVTGNTTNDSGIGAVTLNSHETINIVSNNNALGTVTTNGMEALFASSATGIVISGAADFDLDAITNTTALASINAGTTTGDITIDGIDASVITITGGSGVATSNLEVSMAGLNNADTIIGGSGTADIITGTAVTGLTATTGVLNVTNAETVILQATGANSISGASLSGVNTLAISGANPGTQTITNLGAGVNVQLGEATGAGVVFDAGDIVSISLADATATDDAITINLENDAAGTDADINMTGVETTTFAVGADTNNMTVDLAGVTSPTMLVTGGLAGAELTMGTLNAATTSLDTSGYAGETIVTAASTTAFTLTASGAAAADNYTLGGANDTATIGSTGAVDVDIDMGGGTTDTLNLTVTTGFIDTGEIDGTENLNITIAAGVDINIGANGTAATDANGISDATTVTILGGNELSTLEIGDSAAALADNITAATDIDASGFSGNIFVEYNRDILSDTTDVDAGALATDTVTAGFDTTNTDIVLPFTGVETFIANLNDNDDAANEQYTFDVDTATGLLNLHVASSNGEDTLLDIDDYVSTLTVQLGALTAGTAQAFDNSSEVDINLASAAGSADVVNLALFDTDAAAGIIDIDAAGVETLNIAVTAVGTENHQISLAGATATALSNLAVNLTGGDVGQTVTIANMSASTNVLNAVGFDSNITMTDRSASAMTITGGDGADSIRMENTADVITGGAGADTLVVVHNAIIGGFQANMSSAVDQLSTHNGASNATAQTGFENVDFSLITGGFGADITAQSGTATATTMTGTANADQYNLGTGVDTIIFGQDSGGDTIASFTVGGTAATDNLDLAAAARADFDTVGTAIVNTTGMVILGAAGDAVAGVHTVAKALTELANYNGQITANDNFFFAVDNGTDTAIFHFDDSAAGGGDGGGNANGTEAVLIATLLGVADASTLVVGDVLL